MSLGKTNQRDEETEEHYRSNGNTSDENLLLMDHENDENEPLLNHKTNDIVLREEIRSDRSFTESIHCHVPEDKFDYGSRNRLIIVLIICLIFMLIEIIGGVLSRSIAVMTDAAHMAIDAISFLISLAAMYLATKRPTRTLSFGYIRAEVLGALVSILIIWLATGILVYMAIDRCIDQSFEVQSIEMVIVSTCGVIFNIIMFFVLHANVCGNSIPHHGHSHGGNSHGHSHGGNNHGHSHGGDSHGHSHGGSDNHGHVHDHSDIIIATPNAINDTDLESAENAENKRKVKNINVRAAIVHVIGDFVQSIGVLCAALLIHFKPEYKLADPICTFIFSVLVLITTITIMRDIVLVLMEGVPSHINLSQVIKDIRRIPGVRNAHSLHIWALSMQRTALSVHIAIDPSYDSLAVLNSAQEVLRREHSISRTTIQVELYNEIVMNACESCQLPEN